MSLKKASLLADQGRLDHLQVIQAGGSTSWQASCKLNGSAGFCVYVADTFEQALVGLLRAEKTGAAKKESIL